MNKYADTLAKALYASNLSASEVARRTGLSQATVSRALQSLPVIKLGNGRACQFAWVDDVEGHPLYAIDPAGGSTLLATLYRQPEGRVLLVHAVGYNEYADIPWFLYSALPAGFLGRLHGECLSRRLPINRNPALWTSHEAFLFLLNEADDLAGNLLLGKVSARRYLAQHAPPTPCTHHDYDGMAERIMQTGIAASSVAGEQPKFLAFVTDSEGGDAGYHAIIKYSSPLQVASAAAQRYRDLLVAEHLALECLRAGGIAASESRLLIGQRLHLEVRRFDRVGEHGRKGMVSLRDLEAEYVGASVQWQEAADALFRLQLIDEATQQRMHLLHAFGTLVGNTDMHFGNLAFYFEQLHLAGLAPVYDMLPMMYMPVREEIVARVFRPKPLIGMRAETLQQAVRLAVAYWQAVAEDERISTGFRAIGEENRRVCEGWLG